MRKAILAVALSMLTIGAGMVFLEPSFAQQRGAKDKEKERPRPPSTPRCPDLGLGAHAFVAAVPGEANLADGEVALQWMVRNSGSVSYNAPSREYQGLILEYLTPGGSHQLAIQALPPAAGEATLDPGETWRGYTRFTPSPEARRRQWRLRLAYAGEERYPPPDCSDANNRVMLTRP